MVKFHAVSVDLSGRCVRQGLHPGDMVHIAYMGPHQFNMAENGQTSRKKTSASSGNSSQKNSSEIMLSPDQSVRSSRRQTHIERLRSFLQLFRRDDRVLVVIVADPDSMASAMAVKRLLARRVTEVVIVHPNQIKRVNNLAMRDLLKIPLSPLRGTKRDEFSRFVLLDSQPPHKPELTNIKFDAVIDHHPVTQGWDADYVDIRPDYGATSSMLTEYLKAAKIKPVVALATALFYGIKVDTQNFTKNAASADVLCFQYLFKRINQQLLNKIENSDFRKSELKYFKSAIEAMKTSKNRIYCHVGRVGNPDVLVLLADFFSHVYEIGWVIVSGQYGEKLIVIFRSDGYKKDAGKLATKVFGKLGSAGGHRGSARAEVPLRNIPDTDITSFNTRGLQKFFKRHL